MKVGAVWWFLLLVGLVLTAGFVLDLTHSVLDGVVAEPPPPEPPPPETWRQCVERAFDGLTTVYQETRRNIHSNEAVHALGKMNYDLAVCDRMFPEGEG